MLVGTPPADSNRYFAISVVDDTTGRGVPLVELRTVDQSRYYTDSTGVVAFYEPGLMNQKVYFQVDSDGYQFPADGFGYRGKALLTTPGQSAELRIQRTNIAERLYRVTGAGIYRDSVIVGRDVPLEHPLLNAQVTGSDSVNSIVFRDRLFWFWGDTNRPAYPLGNFHVPGATSKLPEQGGLDPARGVNLEYFTNAEGFAKPTCQMPGDGPTWIDGLCKVSAGGGRERMFARYMKVRKFLEVYERGLVEFNPDKELFEKVVTYDLNAPAMPHGHAFAEDANGQAYLYFGNPYPLVRVRATPEALADLSQFESFTCLTSGSTAAKPTIDRDSAGTIIYAWKRNAPAPTLKDQTAWLQRGKLKSGEGLLALRDVESGKTVNAHAGTVTFNPHRNRYVMITCESGGTSFLGEIWYAEADTPVGPWVYARKIVSHKKYSFYNPRQHPMFDVDGGRRIYFEGTYTTFMTGIEKATPLYDYNQIMYALDLDDPRLVLPLPVYESGGGQQAFSFTDRSGRSRFFAADRPRAGLVAVGGIDNGDDTLAVHAGDSSGKPAFYALPADAPNPSPGTIPLHIWHNSKGRKWYGVDGVSAPEGFVRVATPLCRVWKNPLSFELKP
jgi:hypothetical protein